MRPTATVNGVLTSNPVTLWAAALGGLAAAVTGTWLFLSAPTKWRMPLAMYVVPMWFMAASYWWDIAAVPGVGAEMRRAAGILLWPALTWIALGVVRSWMAQRKMDRAAGLGE